jgi:hypothetical protein
MAVESQSGPCIAALTSRVTYAIPVRTVDALVGCSLVAEVGKIHATDGSDPSAADPR